MKEVIAFSIFNSHEAGQGDIYRLVIHTRQRGPNCVCLKLKRDKKKGAEKFKKVAF